MYRKHPDRIDEAEASASWGFQGSLYSVWAGQLKLKWTYTWVLPGSAQ